jgi:tRNA G37 N-methylase TrmD
MRFDVFTIFPGMFTGFLTESILKRAQQAGLIEIAIHNIGTGRPTSTAQSTTPPTVADQAWS